MDFKGHQRLAARDSICAAAMTPLGRLGRQWNQTGLIFPQDWRYRRAHLCWEWDPSLDLHQIFIAPAQKKRVCARACGLAAPSESVNVELQSLCELWRLLENLSKAFWDWMNLHAQSERCSWALHFNCLISPITTLGFEASRNT